MLKDRITIEGLKAGLSMKEIAEKIRQEAERVEKLNKKNKEKKDAVR